MGASCRFGLASVAIVLGSGRTGKDSRLLTFRLTDVDISEQWKRDFDLGPDLVSGIITLNITVHVAGKGDDGAARVTAPRAYL